MKKRFTICLCLLLCVAMLFCGVPSVLAAGPLSFVTTPESSTFTEGSVATWSASVQASNATYQWHIIYKGVDYDTSAGDAFAQPWAQFMTGSAGTNETGTTFFIEGIGAELDGAQLYCLVTVEGSGFTETPRVTIHVVETAKAPVIEITTNYTIDQNRPLTLSCNAYDPNGGICSYLWYETKTGKLQDIIAINRGNEIHPNYVCDTSTVGKRYYVCMVSTSNGGSAYSDIITVNVVSAAKPPEITTTTLPSATTGEKYEATIRCSDAKATFSISNASGQSNGFADTGLYLSTNGVISGTPKKAGDFTFTVVAKGAGGEDRQQYTLKIKEGAATAVITRQPRNAVVALEEKAVFRCRADHAVSYQWWKCTNIPFQPKDLSAVRLRDDDVYSGTQTDTLTVVGTEALDGVYFVCEVVGEDKEPVYSSTVLLQVKADASPSPSPTAEATATTAPTAAPSAVPPTGGDNGQGDEFPWWILWVAIGVVLAGGVAAIIIIVVLKNKKGGPGSGPSGRGPGGYNPRQMPTAPVYPPQPYPTNRVDPYTRQIPPVPPVNQPPYPTTPVQPQYPTAPVPPQYPAAPTQTQSFSRQEPTAPPEDPYRL